jgi:hypothetical protein
MIDFLDHEDFEYWNLMPRMAGGETDSLLKVGATFFKPKLGYNLTESFMSEIW